MDLPAGKKLDRIKDCYLVWMKMDYEMYLANNPKVFRIAFIAYYTTGR